MSRLDEARDPDTSARRLTELAKSTSPEVLAAVAANPNVSDAVLARLAGRFPGEVLANPRFALLVMGGDGLSMLPKLARLAVLAHPSAPPELLKRAERESIDLNRFVPLATNKSWRPHLLLALAANPRWRPSSRLETLLELARKDVKAVQQVADALREQPPLPAAARRRLGPLFEVVEARTSFARLAEVLEEITTATRRPDRKTPKHALLRAMAAALPRRPDAPAALIEKVVRVIIGWCQRAQMVPSNDRTIDDRFDQLDPAPLLEHPALGRKRLEALALASDDPMALTGLRGWAAEALAKRGETSAAVLALADHASGLERAIAARVAPAEVLERLAADADPRVRLAVAGSPGATPSLLARLVGDEQAPAVALAALAHPASDPAVRAAAARSRWRAVRRVLAGQASPDEIEHLAADEDGLVRSTLAARTDAPEALLRALAGDDSAMVRRAVAKNRAAPVDALEALARDAAPNVRDGVRKNRGAPKHVRTLAEAS